MLVLIAALAPWLAPYDPARQSLIEKRAKPGGKYLLGADEFGRDILSRVIYGSRVALLVGVLSVAIALVGGLALGTVAGFPGGWLDAAHDARRSRSCWPSPICCWPSPSWPRSARAR